MASSDDELYPLASLRALTLGREKEEEKAETGNNLVDTSAMARAPLLRGVA